MGNDISVIHVDPAPLLETTVPLPVCLPDPGQSYLLQYATQSGQNVKAFKQPAVKKGLFKTLESYTWAKSPVVKHFDVESCEVVTGRAIGGFYTIANGSLCLNSQSNSVSGGDLVMAPNSNGQLALIGIGQHSAKDYVRSRQETATRLSCYLDWVAGQYGLQGESSQFEATWSTGCPQEDDIQLGAPGAKSQDIGLGPLFAETQNSGKTQKVKERNRVKKANVKGNKKKSKAKRILTITEDNVDDIHIDIHGDS